MSERRTKALGVAAIVLLAGTSPAYAYLDPGTGTMLLQGLIAALAGGAAVISLKYAQLKQFLSKVFNRRAVGPSAGKGPDTN